MTPDEAAAVLGIRRDADEAEVDRAYRRLARELHPDRFIGAPEAAVHAASERFIDVTRAREVLLKTTASRTQAAPAPAPGPGPGARSGTQGGPTDPRGRVAEQPVADAAAADRPAGPFSWWLFGAWALLLTVGALLSFSGGPVLHPLDLWLRLLLLVLFALATAITRRRWVWRVTLVLIAVSAVATVVHTTIVGLLGLGFMIVASFGLAVQARLVRFPD
jgi:DnaJ domain